MSFQPSEFDMTLHIDRNALLERDKVIVYQNKFHLTLGHDASLFAVVKEVRPGKASEGGGLLMADAHRPGWELRIAGQNPQLGVGLTAHEAKLDAVRQLRALADDIERADIGFKP